MRVRAGDILRWVCFRCQKELNRSDQFQAAPYLVEHWQRIAVEHGRQARKRSKAKLRETRAKLNKLRVVTIGGVRDSKIS